MILLTSATFWKMYHELEFLNVESCTEVVFCDFVYICLFINLIMLDAHAATSSRIYLFIFPSMINCKQIPKKIIINLHLKVKFSGINVVFSV